MFITTFTTLDKFALITGASQGLGRELALAYAREDVRGLALVARGKQQLQKIETRNYEYFANCDG